MDVPENPSSRVDVRSGCLETGGQQVPDDESGRGSGVEGPCEVDARVILPPLAPGNEAEQTKSRAMLPTVSAEVAPTEKSHKNLTMPPTEDAPEKASRVAQHPVGYVRHIVAVLSLSSIVLANMNRQAFNQALVSMTKSASATPSTLPPPGLEPSESFTTSSPEVSNFTAYGELIIEELDDRFDWSQKQIATLQSAFSFGYTPFMIPAGRLCEVYGAKWIVFISGFGSALCTILTPFLADNSFSLLVMSRTIMGLCQTAVSPALFAICVRWLPQSESNVYLPMMKVGVMVGFTSGSLVSGFSTWRVTFYLVGVIGLAWSTLWAMIAASDPSDSKYLSKGELNYIKTELQNASPGAKQSDRKATAPWLSIFTNPVILAFSLAKFTVKMSTDVQTMQIPLYLRNIFHVSKKLNGVLTATNFAIQSLFTGIVAYGAKELVVRQTFGINKTGVRRLFQGLCNFGMAFAYALITFNMASIDVVYVAIILLSIASMFGAGGEALTPVDISLEYSATIMAIANSVANCSGLVLPSLVAIILDGKTLDSDSWNRVWWVIGSIMFLGGLVYSSIVTAQPQNFESKSKTKAIAGKSVEMKEKI